MLTPLGAVTRPVGVDGAGAGRSTETWRVSWTAMAPSAVRSTMRLPSQPKVATVASAARYSLSCSITPGGSGQKRMVEPGMSMVRASPSTVKPAKYWLQPALPDSVSSVPKLAVISVPVIRPTTASRPLL